MRTLLLGALLLLVPACLKYEIEVTTTVHPDGKTRRTLHIRCDEQKTWKRLQPPGELYSMEGDEENGFVATARLRPGRHPNALRVLLGDHEEYGGAAGAMGIRAAEGTVEIRRTDLLIGTLYSYEERIAIGNDPERFRTGVRKWLDVALRWFVEALRLKFPDMDFGPVEKKARTEVLPDFERAIIGAHRAATALVAEWQAQAGDEDALGRALLEAIVGEAGTLGVEVELPPGPPWEDRAVEAMFWQAWTQLLARLLEPLPEAQRATVKGVLAREDALDDVGEQAATKLFPDEAAQEKAQEEAVAWLTDGFGAYVAQGLFDSFELHFRVELPGRLLRTNGDLGTGPVVEWRIDESYLVLVPPVLFAHSFVAAEGVEGEIWDLRALREIESELADLPAEQRGALEEAVATAVASGWSVEPELADDATGVFNLLRNAATKARRQ